MRAPVILGLNRTQDASACLLNQEGGWLLQKERITRRKHDWGRLGDLDLYLDRLPVSNSAVDLVVECYSSDGEAARRASYRREITRRLGPVEVATVSHHLAHAYSAFFPSGMPDSAVMVIDFQGSALVDCVEKWQAPNDAAPTDLEVASFYACTGRELVCVEKQLWNGDRRHPAGLGFFYRYLAECIFPGEGQEGKVMGLAPHGDVHRLRLPPLDVAGPFVHIPAKWCQVFADRQSYRYGDDPAQFRRSADLAAAGQHAFEEALLSVAKWLRKRTGSSRLSFVGGTALNCVANGRLLRESGFSEIFVPPSPSDGGTALGCALYGRVTLLGRAPRFVWRRDFLGPTPAPLTRSYARQRGLRVERPHRLADAVAERLAAGQTVAVFHGRSESGPRALGNRSIFADARDAGMVDWINTHIKGREPFRPLAPIVLAEEAANWFDIDRPLPFMQFAANVRPERRKQIPSVTHVDGSARIQTVSRSDNPFVHAILRAFFRRTGVPLFINTSLNGQDEPLVETMEEAITLFLATPLHMLVSPPYLAFKRATRLQP